MTIELVYHTNESAKGGISPFDKTIKELVENKNICIICPYIGLAYFNRIIEWANSWHLVTDVEVWMRSYNQNARLDIKKFINEHISNIHHCEYIHAKVILTEKRILIGSANFTEKGIIGRVEMSVLIESKNIDIENIVRNNKESHERLIECIKLMPNRDWINSYFDFAKELIEFTGLTNDDPRLVMSITRNAKIPISINQRYVLMPYYNGNVGLIMLLEYDSKNHYSDRVVFEDENYFTTNKIKKARWLQFERTNRFEFSEKIIKYWKQAVLAELKRGKISKYRKFHEPVVYEAVMNLSYRNKILNEAFSEQIEK